MQGSQTWSTVSSYALSSKVEIQSSNSRVFPLKLCCPNTQIFATLLTDVKVVLPHYLPCGFGILWKSWVMSQKKYQLRQVIMWLSHWENSREGTDAQEKGKNSLYCLVSWPSRPCRCISLLLLGNRTSCNIATHSPRLATDSSSWGREETLRFRPFSFIEKIYLPFLSICLILLSSMHVFMSLWPSSLLL